MKETIIKIKGKVVGKIIGKEYVTKRVESKPFMFKFQGYGISEKILDFLKIKEVEKIRIEVDKETFLFTLDDYLKSKKTYTYNEDLQRFVSTNETFKNKKLNNFIK